MSIPIIYRDVINGLLQKSFIKEVIWDVTTNSNVFVVYFKDSSLTLHQHINQNDAWISVDIIDDKGDKIDGFWVSEEESDDWVIMSDLFSIARRSALAIDDTIKEILSELKVDGTIGQKRKKADSNKFTDDIPF